MKPIRLSAVATAVSAVIALAMSAGGANAQTAYPSQSIRFIVPYAPGGFPDTTARIVGQRLQERLGHSVVIENRPGGAGSVAVAAVLGLPADGYTFLVTDGSLFSVNPLIFKQIAYDGQRDLTPVARVGIAPLILAVNSKVPVSNLQEFVAYVKARPGQVNYGSSGVGSPHHLSMEAVAASLDLKMTHVPYRGTGQSVPALLGGHVDVLFSAYPSLVGALEAKTVKLLATNGLERSPLAPEVPPLADTMPGFNFASLAGLFAKAGTPQPIIDRIAAEVVAIAGSPEVAKQFAAAGIDPAGAGPEALRKAIAAETEVATRLVKLVGLTPQ